MSQDIEDTSNLGFGVFSFGAGGGIGAAGADVVRSAAGTDGDVAYLAAAKPVVRVGARDHAG
jgi:hypothetical protein